MMCTAQCHRTNLGKQNVLLSHLTDCCSWVSVLFGTSFLFYTVQLFSLAISDVESAEK